MCGLVPTSRLLPYTHAKPPPSLGLRRGDALVARGGSMNITCTSPSYCPPVTPSATNPTSTLSGSRQLMTESNGLGFATVDLSTDVLHRSPS